VGRDGNRTRYECSYSQNLGFQRLLGSGVGKTLEELVDSLYLAYDSLKLKMLLAITQSATRNIKQYD
jgi:phosphate acetyltransferase